MRILEYPHPKLLTYCNSAFEIGAQTLVAMFDIMVQTHALGLSANQVGIDARLFITYWGSVFVNLHIYDYDQGDMCASREGCLSYPSGGFIRKRSMKIVTSAGRFEGLQAIVIQHEMDHINGKEVWHD
jgi:peptide deformylase